MQWVSKLSPGKDLVMQSNASIRHFRLGFVALVAFALVPRAVAQNYDLTMDVLVNSSNTTGYNTSASSPGEYQRYLERYLEHLQIPYREIDTATENPPASLGTAQLIVAAHTGLSLSSSWQQAIVQAVQGGSGFVNFDADSAIGTDLHMQSIFGATGSSVGATATSIVVPSAVMPDGANPHFIAAMQLRFQDTPAGDLVYAFHEDSNGLQQVATPTLLQGAQGAVIAKVGASPLILATQTSGGRAVDFTTYDFMHPDRFGFMMGVDDLVWRSLVWAARKPFILRGYPRLWASQMDNEVVGWGTRLQLLWDPSLTGAVSSDGTGGPWKVNANAQLANLPAGGQDRAQAIADVNSGFMKICLDTKTGISEGDLYWNPQSSSPLTDAQWQANLAYALQVMQGNGGTDTLPTLSKSMVPHYWNLSNNVGYDLWNSLGARYITEIQMPGAYYNYGPPKTDAMRIKLRPFRIYELPPTGIDPDERYPLYYADYMTVGSTAGLPAVKFFSFATQLLGTQFSTPDARWPNDLLGFTVQDSVNNFTEYTWRFFSGMAPVQIYNHDSDSFDLSTTAEAQQTITQISSFLNAKGAVHVFMEEEGAYLCARTQSVLTTAQATASTISLNFTGNAADMDGNLVPTYFYLYWGDHEGVQQQVPGFSGGYTFSMPNPVPPLISLSTATLTFAGLAGSAPTSQTVTLTNTGGGTLAYTVQSSAAWLTASGATGTAPDMLTVTANPGALTDGVYTGTIQIVCAGASNSPQVISVTLNVRGATLAVSTNTLSFSGTSGSANPAAQNITISNGGDGSLNWTASSSASWLQLGSTSGSIVNGSPYTLALTPNITGMQPGTYTSAVTIASSNAVSGSPQTVNVTLIVTGVILESTFSDSTLDGWAYSPLGLASGWSASNGVVSYNGRGATQLYAGNASMSNYTVQAGFLLSSLTDYPGGIRGYINPSTGASYAAWIYPAERVVKVWRTSVWSISSNPVLLGTSARLTMDATNWHTLALSMMGGKIVASYDGKSVVTATDSQLSGGMIALDVSSVPIQFDKVIVTGSQAITTNLTSAQSSYTFTAVAGGTSASKSLQVATDDSSVAAWSALSPSPWLTVTATTGQTPGNTAVQVNASALTAGSYSGQINLASLGVANSPVVVPVTVVVSQPPAQAQLNVSPAALSFTAVSGAPTPATQSLTLTSTASALAFTVSSDSTWLTSTATGSTSASVQVNVNQDGLAVGTYTGNLTISAANAANPTTTVTVTLVVVAAPSYSLMQDNFSSSTLDGWAVSPLGLASGWSVSNNAVQYNGGGASQIYAGSASWSNYVVQAGVLLSSLTDYPGGIRGYVNSTTGASYTAWIYPAEGVIKVWRTTAWSISSNPVLLGTSAHLTLDAANWHTLALSMYAGQVVAYYDGKPVVVATDSVLSGGMIALDGSTVSVQFDKVVVSGYRAASTDLTSSQSSYTFTVAAGSTSSTQTLQIATSDSTVAVWSALSASSWLTVTPTTGQTPGSATVQVNASALTAGSYSGQLNLVSFGAVNSPIAVPITVNVTEAVIPTPSFSVASNAASLSISKGKSGLVTFTVTPKNGFNQAVTFACSGLPSEATCVFSPSSVTPNGSAVSSQLTITTAAATSAMLHRESGGPGLWRRASGMVACALLLCVLPGARRRRIWRYLATLLLAVALCLSPVLGCGGGGSSAASGTSDQGTPSGTSTITITASSGSGSSITQQTATLTLTVTN
jgi:hypothetical protein